MAKKKKHTCSPEFWVDQYADEFYRFAIYRVKSSEVAEDLVQETFLSGLQALKNFRGDCPEKSWLYNILRNKIIDHYRKKTNQEIRPGNWDEETDEAAFLRRYFKVDASWQNDKSPANWAISADQILEREEFMQFLLLCLSLLPKNWSKVFSLKNLEEYSTKEICKELSITPSNLWTIIHRSKLQLRACLEKRWQDK